ncbi:hypothetical protein DSECCO2_527880 [anaerobic digester metagenome]
MLSTPGEEASVKVTFCPSKGDEGEKENWAVGAVSKMMTAMLAVSFVPSLSQTVRVTV